MKTYRFNPRYILNKIRSIIYFKKFPDRPWISREAFEVLDLIISPSDKVLEFGSGKSTSYFASKCSYVYSVESNFQWYKKVVNKLTDLSSSNVNIKYAENESEYLDLSFIDNEITILFIDGRYRLQSLKEGLKYASDNAIIIIDNSQRYLRHTNFNSFSPSQTKNICQDDWLDVFHFLNQHYRHLVVSNGIEDTSFFLKL